MIIVVNIGPLIPTDITELIPAFANHVIAAVSLFNNIFAFFTLTIMQVTFKILNFMRIALVCVGGEEASCTEFFFTYIANHCVVPYRSNHALTILSRTYFQVRIFGNYEESIDFSVIFLNIQRQRLEET